MKIVIEIQCDNAAFHDPEPNLEIGRILAKLASDMEGGSFDGYKVLMDANGNRVGACDTVPDVWDA
ncbi:hypothetical protein LCGC14_0358010 [marine sediment metagenome]|uniref:Uncharacterized protein n=1 Tax=marine sediment metagenome TaxID=412755 RepID=A0A0F9T8V8_9ZZZZ